MSGVFKIAIGVAAAVAAVIAVLFVLEEYNPASLRGREIRNAYDAGDGERLLELAARRNWPADQRRFAMGTYTRMVRDAPDRWDAFERRLSQLRDTSDDDEQRSYYLWALDNLNTELLRATADEFAARVDHLVSSRVQEDLPFDAPQTVDLQLNLMHPLRRRDEDDPGPTYVSTWRYPRESIPGLIGLDGLTRAEIQAQLEAARRIGAVVHYSRIVGSYQGCNPDESVAHYERTEAVQRFAAVYIIDLETDTLISASVVEGEPPASTIAIRRGSTDCSSEGSRPDLDRYLYVQPQ